MTPKLPGFEDIRPPKPASRDASVARRIAERIVEAVNMDDFYWEGVEIEDRVAELTMVLMDGTPPRKLIDECNRRWPGCDWQWEGIDDHARHIAQEIIDEEVSAAVAHWKERYF